jgi:crotonobetainyl-CoA:carnitine CoA-transferase CaiB-like acyl-CoA transferase
METKHALSGLKVADFSWVIVGPVTTKYLAINGATVIKVESRKKVDMARTYIPMAKGVAGLERCAWFDAYATNKYSISLNLNHPKGRDVAKKLVAWSDVVVENFMPGTMKGWQLDYENLKRVKPDIIMLSNSMYGQTGPLAKVAGLGAMQQAAVGCTHIVGWPDRAPTGFSLPYTDYVSPWYAIMAIMAALEYRRKTGKGQHIDLSQAEAGVSFIAPAILDYTVNKHVAPPMGNRSDHAVPHGAFRCKGEDQWCVLAVSSDKEWRSFCNVLGNPEWCREPKFASFASRKHNEDELEKLVENHTAQHDARAMMWKLQRAGVPAGVVQNGKDLHEDEQLAHREHFVKLDHPEIGLHSYDAPPYRFSKTPAQIKRSPLFGEHNTYVYTELLGLSDSEFNELLSEGVFE